MNWAIAGIVTIGVAALITASVVKDPSAVGACITLASGAAGSLGGYISAHRNGAKDE